MAQFAMYAVASPNRTHRTERDVRARLRSRRWPEPLGSAAFARGSAAPQGGAAAFPLKSRKIERRILRCMCGGTARRAPAVECAGFASAFQRRSRLRRQQSGSRASALQKPRRHLAFVLPPRRRRHCSGGVPAAVQSGSRASALQEGRVIRPAPTARTQPSFPGRR